MPVRRRNIARRELTDEQVSELLLGPPHGPTSRPASAFASDDERRMLWKWHRDAIMWDIVDTPEIVWAYRVYELGEES